MTYEKIHICIITASKIFNGPIGGEGKYTLSLAHWLLNNNVNITILANQFLKVFVVKLNDKEKETQKKRATIISFSFLPYFFYMIFKFIISFLLVVKIIQIHSKSHISLIHAQDTGSSGLAAIIAGKLLKIPVIVSSHGVRHKTIQSSIRSRLKNIIFKIEKGIDLFVINHAKHVITDNNSIKEYLKNLGAKANINCIPVPINLSQYYYSVSNRRKLRQDLLIDENIIVIGYIGRFAPEKNIFSIIDALEKIISLKNQPKVTLLLVGTGPLETDLKNYARKKNVYEHVIFTGLRQDINNVLSCIDIFILTSFTEGMSAALMEAMAVNRTIICSNLETNAELITNKQEGFLVDPYNIEQLVQTILVVISNVYLREQLGNNARKKVTGYEINKVFPRLLEIYLKLIKRPSEQKC